jgi:hypothetical protein
MGALAFLFKLASGILGITFYLIGGLAYLLFYLMKGLAYLSIAALSIIRHSRVLLFALSSCLTLVWASTMVGLTILASCLMIGGILATVALAVGIASNQHQQENYREADLSRNQVLNNLALDEQASPPTEEQFKRLQLSDGEYNVLKSAQLPEFTSDEINRLRLLDDDETKDLLKRYENLKRLRTDDCMITQVRPEKGDTILLGKQLLRGGQWLPVPGVSHVFDRNELKSWFLKKPVHPTERDNILDPDKYQVGADELRTRYVYHDYYPSSESMRGVSQEENHIAASLKAKLQRVPEICQDEDEVEPGCSPGYR